MDKSKIYISKARKQPAVISAIFTGVLFGVIIFKNGYIQDALMHLLETFGMVQNNAQLIKILKYIIPTALLATVGTSFFALYYLLLREIGKLFPEAFINYLFLLPTSRFLCTENKTFPQAWRSDILEKLESKYSIRLKRIKKKSKHNRDYLNLLDSAIAKLRNDTREDEILFSYNCIYGFWRNLTGGILFNLGLLLVLLIFDCINKDIQFLSCTSYIVIVSIMFALLILLTIITDTNGKRYAKQLFSLL